MCGHDTRGPSQFCTVILILWCACHRSAADCVYSEWTEWSGCICAESTAEFGSHSRTRKAVSGTICPDMVKEGECDLSCKGKLPPSSSRIGVATESSLSAGCFSFYENHFSVIFVPSASEEDHTMTYVYVAGGCFAGLLIIGGLCISNRLNMSARREASEYASL